MFDAALAYQARIHPRALAFITPRRRWTYAEFDADVNRYAAALQALGVTPARGIVAVEASSTYRSHVLLMALARLGVASTARADARADLRLTVKPGPEADGLIRLTPDWTARVEAAPPIEVASAPRDPEGVARVLLSSGTTKAPRRVPLSWRRMEAGGMNALSVYAAGRLGVWAIRTGVDSSLGYSMATLAWSLGAAVAADYGAADLPHLMERHPVGLLGLTPVQLRELLRALPPGFEPKPGWRGLVTGGLLPAPVAREARQRLTADLFVVYGSTESGRSLAGPAIHLESTPGAVGWPVPGVSVEIVDAEGRAVADGEQGEVRIRSDRVAGRYLDDPDETARVFRDGWFHPGDLGRRLPGGLFVIDGRIDERMNLGGVKLLPNVLENALLEHPQVLDAAAFLAPDAQGIDHCWIAVVHDGEVSRESLMATLKAARVRLPSIRFAWSQEIPRNAMGKIDRQALRTQTIAALGQPPAGA